MDGWKGQPGVAKLMGYLGCWGASPGKIATLGELMDRCGRVYELESDSPSAMARKIGSLNPKTRRDRAAKNFPAVMGAEAVSPGRHPKSNMQIRPARSPVGELARDLGVDADRLADALKAIANGELPQVLWP